MIFGVGSLLTAMATTIEALSVFRVLTGLGMGGAMPNAIALTSEYMPARHRSMAVTAMICGFSLGAAVGGFVAAALIPRYGWQAVFVAGGVTPLLIAAVAAAVLPESIRFLLLRGNRPDEAARSLARIAPGVEVPRALLTGGVAGLEADGGGAGRIRDLFTEGRAPVTVLIWVVYFMNLLNLYFLNSWLPTIMSDAGIPVETAIRVTALFQVGGIAGALVLGRVLDRYRSFRVLAVCFLWAAVWVFLTGEAGASVPLLIVAMLAAGVGVIGGQNASHALSAEFYPTAVRSTGVGWALGIGRIGSIIGPIVGGYLLAQGGGARHVFWAAAVPALVATAAATALGFMRRSDLRVSHSPRSTSPR